MRGGLHPGPQDLVAGRGDGRLPRHLLQLQEAVGLVQRLLLQPLDGVGLLPGEEPEALHLALQPEGSVHLLIAGRAFVIMVSPDLDNRTLNH